MHYSRNVQKYCYTYHYALSTSVWVCYLLNCILLDALTYRIYSSSAVFSVGAGTLADIYEPHERGSMMGIYYAAPLLGPSLGPIIGGALTEAWSWRATFYFLAAFCALSLGSFFLFKDTFRRERSLAYQNAVQRVKAHLEYKEKHGTSTPSSQRTSISERTIGVDVPNHTEKDVEAQSTEKEKTPSVVPSVQDVKLSLRDVNPLAPLPKVLRIRSNLIVLIASGVPISLIHRTIRII